jgi:hypothetical protein
MGSSLMIGWACVACGGANQRLLGQPVPAHQTVAVLVRTSPEVNEADTAGGVATLVETVTNGLHEHGIESQIYAANDDNPPPPRIELWVEFWHQRSQASRDTGASAAGVGAAMPIAGGAVSVVSLAMSGPNKIIVNCRVFRGRETASAFEKRFQSIGLADDPNGVAESVGNSILSAVLR